MLEVPIKMGAFSNSVRLRIRSNRDHVSAPGTIKRIVRVDMPRPRDRNGYPLIELHKSIYREFFTDEDVPEDYEI